MRATLPWKCLLGTERKVMLLFSMLLVVVVVPVIG
jgi:hypothetical protein